MKITFIENSNGGIFSLDNAYFTVFMRQTKQTDDSTSVGGNIYLNYGDIISDMLNSGFANILKLYWNSMYLFTGKLNGIESVNISFPWSYELFETFFKLNYGILDMSDYPFFIDNVICDDDSALSNIQKAALFTMVFETGGNLFNYIAEYKLLYDGGNEIFDKETYDIHSQIFTNPHNKEGMKMAIELFRNKDVPISVYGNYLFADFENFFKFILCKAITLNVKIKKCANCGKYFYPEKRADAIYCDNKSPQDTNLTCKEYGSQKLWYDKLRDNECMKLYRNVYQSKQMLVKRNPDIKAYSTSFERFKEQSQEWKNDVKNGVKTEVDFIEWLNRAKNIKT